MGYILIFGNSRLEPQDVLLKSEKGREPKLESKRPAACNLGPHPHRIPLQTAFVTSGVLDQLKGKEPFQEHIVVYLHQQYWRVVWLDANPRIQKLVKTAMLGPN